MAKAKKPGTRNSRKSQTDKDEATLEDSVQTSRDSAVSADASPSDEAVKAANNGGLEPEKPSQTDVGSDDTLPSEPEPSELEVLESSQDQTSEKDTGSSDDAAVDDTTDEAAASDGLSQDAETLDGTATQAEASQTDDVERPPEPAAASTEMTSQSPPPVVQQVQKVGFGPVVFGGVVAALLGFIAGRSDQIEAYLPASIQRSAPDLTAVEDQLSQLSQTTQALAADVAAIEPADTSDLSTSIDDLSARIDAVEARPLAQGSADTSGLETDIERLGALIAQQSEQLTDQASQLTDQSAQIAQLQGELAEASQNEAQSGAQELLARAALTRVAAAIETGAAYEDALTDLEMTGVADIPENLRQTSEGVPTLASLIDTFPDAARGALAAAREEEAGAGSVGLGGFLKRQLGARSVVPRDGDDPDAVLSRAENALKSGDLSDALAQLDNLPAAAQAEMTDWLDRAQTRQSALDAANTLSERLTTN